MKQYTKDYFEGILQIRGGDEQLLNWIHQKIKTDKKAAITKTKKVKNGIDLYITDQHYLQNLGKKIKEHQSGLLKISKRLHTQDKLTSKHLYRVTVLFKPFKFKKGDVLLLYGEQVQIINTGKKIQVKDLKSGAKKFVNEELLT